MILIFNKIDNINFEQINELIKTTIVLLTIIIIDRISDWAKEESKLTNYFFYQNGRFSILNTLRTIIKIMSIVVALLLFIKIFKMYF